MIALVLASMMVQPDLDVALSAAAKRAVERATPSVVRIDLVGSGSEGPRAMTGVVVDGEGRIATSAHLFERGGVSAVVSLANGDRTPAKLIGVDKVFRLACLQIDKKAPSIGIAPPDGLRVGCYSLAIGRGLSESPTASLGVVSALGRVLGKAIQTDAKTSPTNYGGPLVDLEGRAFGVIVPLSADDGMTGTDLYDSGIGFAVSMADVLRSVDRIKKGAADRGMLGLAFRGKKPLDGPLVVESLAWKSPVSDAGFRRGDRIKSVDGKPIKFYSQFRSSIGRLYAGDSIKIEVDREGKSISAVVKSVAKFPVYRQPFLGLRLEEKDGRLLVQSVEGPAAALGLKVKDAIVELDGPTKTIKDVETRLAAKSAGDAFALVIERDGKREVKAIKCTAWPESMPAAVDATTGAGKATVTQAPAPMKYWIQRTASQPVSLLIVAAPAKSEHWKAACEKYGVAVIGSEEQLDGPIWKSLVPKIQQSMKLDARRTAVVGQGTAAEMFANSLDSSVGGIAADGGPISPPAAQPNESRRYLVLRRLGSGALVEAIKTARDEGVPITEFEIVDSKPEILADAVARWAAGLGRY